MPAENFRRDTQRPIQIEDFADLIRESQIDAANTATEQTKEVIAKWLKEEDEPTLIKLLKHFVNS
jgi:hypothetical protein